jgi:hypothetical protein
MKGEEVDKTIPPTTGFAPFSFFSIDQERSIKSMRRRQIAKNLLKKDGLCPIEEIMKLEEYFLSKS